MGPFCFYIQILGSWPLGLWFLFSAGFCSLTQGRYPDPNSAAGKAQIDLFVAWVDRLETLLT